jgi:hypothetical protein
VRRKSRKKWCEKKTIKDNYENYVEKRRRSKNYEVLCCM